MRLLRKHAFARAGLAGNPSDGYGGKTISFVIRDFGAEVVLYEWDQMEIVWSQEDRSRFRGIRELARDVRLHGYYGGIRLVKATIKRFVDYCDEQDISLHDGNFSVRYESNIPRQVGLAGSSGIIIATLRALSEFYEVEIPLRVLPSLALSVETEELGIPGGLQDRVVQVYEGLVAMDFTSAATETLHGLQCGSYTPLEPSLLPPIYVAYSTETSEPTEVFHNNLRARFHSGEPEVVDAMKRLSDLVDEVRDALTTGDHAKLHTLIDENYDIRAGICRLSASHVQMVETARSTGASAKFAGSGGAIVGTFESDSQFQQLRKELGRIECAVIRPRILPCDR